MGQLKASLVGGLYDGEIVDIVGKYHIKTVVYRGRGRAVYAVYSWMFLDGKFYGRFAGYFRDTSMRKRARLTRKEKKSILAARVPR